MWFSAETATAQEPPYVQHENVVYGEAHGVGLLMDIFTPKGDANGLGVVDVISGAWHSDRGKIRDHERARTFHTLCDKGYTVFAIRPGSITKFNVAEMLSNLNEGIRWVKEHAGDYQVDPERLGLMGAFRRRSPGVSGGGNGRGRAWQFGRQWCKPEHARESRGCVLSADRFP